MQLEQCDFFCSLLGETRPNTGVASPIGTRYGTQLLQHTRALSLRQSQEQRSCGVALRRINKEPGPVAEYNYIKGLILGKIYLLSRAVFTPVTAVLTERAFIRLDSRGACRPQFCLPKSSLHYLRLDRCNGLCSPDGRPDSRRPRCHNAILIAATRSG